MVRPMSKTRIGIFGGSFDPPTKGHLHIAEHLLDSDVVDEVMFVPAYKSYHGKKYGATSQQRIDMLELLCDSSKYGGDMGALSISDFEITNKLTGGTYEYISKFFDSIKSRDDRDEYEFYFIIGMDNAMVIDTYIKSDDLLNMIPFIVVDRDSVRYHQDSNLWFNSEPHKYVPIDDIHKNTSSSEIRKSMKNFENENIGFSKSFFHMCDVVVFAYMLNYELYMTERLKNENC